MPRFIETPTVIQAAGNKPKQIEEFFGRANTGTPDISIARMKSPSGWAEPFQRPAFDEYTLVLAGEVLVEYEGGARTLSAGQAVFLRAGEKVRYSTPTAAGAEYIAVCLPAFSPDTVHREGE